MSRFRRVDDKQAGPRALGILVPPGLQTMVIIRPRALSYDLIPANSDHPAQFGIWDRDDAAIVAKGLYRVFDQLAHRNTNPIVVTSHPETSGFLVWANTQLAKFVACRRAPGQPYCPEIFATAEEATRLAHDLESYLCPSANAIQDYYFNTQHFSG